MTLSSPHKKLLEDGGRLFSQRQSLDQFWQEVAYQFYVEMAEFTVDRYLGDEFADHLSTSYPLLARRTLGDSLGALLRPRNLDTISPGVWFGITTDGEEDQETDARRWLQFATGVQRSAMYDRAANFVKATKTGDHSFVTFGQAPLMMDLNKNRDTLLYRCYHLKDVVWSEDAEEQICAVWRKWSPTATDLAGVFKDRVAPEVKNLLEQDPYQTVECWHIVLRSEKYEERDKEGKRWRTPWVSIWLDKTNEHAMEEVGSFSRLYIIPRWVTIPGTQYASSPCVTAALPDARLIQAMSLTLLESGEKFADPPMVATQEAVKGGIELFAGGITYVDAEYDERLGEAVRPIYDPRAGEGMRAAIEARNLTREDISKAFFLDSLSLPPADVRKMTAFEVGQRMSEWIRRAMPIFEPVEYEYNAMLCEETFELLLRNGAFGSLEDMPQSLRGANVQFKFESPLHESASRRKGQKFLEAQQILLHTAQIDQSVMPMLKAKDALRDVLRGIGASETWISSEREMAEFQRAQQAEQEGQQALIGGMQGAEMAEKLGSAAKDFSEAGAAGGISG